MKFNSTRGLDEKISSSQAIINGISKDGGLYVPESFPNLYEKIKNDINLSYEDMALKVIREFFDDFTDNELIGAIDRAYKNRFKVEENKNFLELYHGPTSAFKDAALLFLPQIMDLAKKKLNIDDDIVILSATSGDTGKAALEGFSSVDGFKTVVYYPKDGVSLVQERQMVSQEGENVNVIGIKGNFDHAQRGVKEIFSDENLKEELLNNKFRLSSANSINIGRLVPQIVYYYYGYFQLVNKKKINHGDMINVVVPTGNFGNILAAYYAREMGLPIKKFICASNENKVLSDFFKSGTYDRRRDLVLTTSPSMDILVSSNLERLLFEITNRNSEKVKNFMNELNTKGIYTIDDISLKSLEDFYANYAKEEEVSNAIRKVYEEENYLMDTHTAVAYVVLNKYISETKDDTPYLIASTASPYKFPKSVLDSLNVEGCKEDDFKLIDILNEYCKVEIPNNLKDLDKKKVYHDLVCEVCDMKKALLEFLEV